MNNEKMAGALQVIMHGLVQQPEQLRDDFVACIASASIALMRGRKGDEFTEGFLDAAKASDLRIDFTLTKPN